MNFKRILLLSISFFVVACITAQTKVCFVNSAELFSKMDDTQKGAEELENYRTKLSNDFADFEKQVNTALETFFRDSARLTPAVKEAKRTALQKSIAELSAKKPEYNNMIEAKAAELDNAIKLKLNTAIKKVAIANGYTQILLVDAAILYPKDDEITDRVKTELGIK